MDVLLWPRMQSSLFDPRVYHQGIPALVEEMLCALAFRGLWVWGVWRVLMWATYPSMIFLCWRRRAGVTSWRVCLHGVSVYAVALAVVVVVRRSFKKGRDGKGAVLIAGGGACHGGRRRPTVTVLCQCECD